MCNVMPFLGYSAGEYTAAYFAGVISKTDLIRLYYLRNRLLEKLPEGKMASVLGNPEKFSLPEGVYVSARNAPNRFMITGLAEDIDQYLCELDAKTDILFCIAAFPCRALSAGRYDLTGNFRNF